MNTAFRAASDEKLPVDDPVLRDPGLDLAMLATHWSSYGARRPMTAEQMRGADRRAQRLGIAARELMEQAGTAVAAAARALLNSTDRPSGGTALFLCGPGNNGGDGFVAARVLASYGIATFVVLVSTDDRPRTLDAAANWDALDGLSHVDKMHAASAHDVGLLLNGIERAALVVDALLGTGVTGPLRDPISSAVDVCLAARRNGVPILSVDTPTALDLTSGHQSEPNVRADLTVTFHRPKEGLITRTGRIFAGKLLVAPIGIPIQADVG
ncbi:MAG TPA: NAD(P)H-hydrate epimerase [Candidatus Limnocylindrales bacterium]